MPILLCSVGLFHLVGAWLEPPARPLPNPEIPIHVSVSLTNPRRPESPNKGKMPKSPVLKVTAASSPEVTTRLSAQFWLHLGTNLAHGRHVITPHLQCLKSLCFGLGVRLLWPPSLGPENLPRSWSAWIYPDTLFQFVLIWFTASTDKPIVGVGRKPYRWVLKISYLLLKPNTLIWPKEKPPLRIDIGVFFNFKTICFKKQDHASYICKLHCNLCTSS